MNMVAPQTARSEAGAMASRKTIPFDYTFRFALTGQRDNALKSLVTVSVEATFVAVAIGYGATPRSAPIRFGAEFTERTLFRDIKLDDILKSLRKQLAKTPSLLKGEAGPEAVFKIGFKLNPQVAERALLGIDDPSAKLDTGILEKLFQVVGTPPEQIQFLYALFDEATGREFQSAPILNIAGLGAADGNRPFRYFPQPIEFAPRSSIRMEVTEKSDFQGELQVSLIGYKVLGEAGTPTELMRRRTMARRRR